MLRAIRRRVYYAVVLGGLMLSAAAFCVPSLVNTMRPEGIIIHHSAIPPLPGGRTVDAELIDEFHRERGYGAFYWGRFYHIGYHYVILPDGTVQGGRPEHCRGAHATGYNAYIGICLVGNFSTADNPAGERGLQEPTEAQLRALTNLCRRLQERYHIPTERVLRHSDVNPSTNCPGDRFPLSHLLAALGEAQ